MTTNQSEPHSSLVSVCSTASGWNVSKCVKLGKAPLNFTCFNKTCVCVCVCVCVCFLRHQLKSKEPLCACEPPHGMYWKGRRYLFRSSGILDDSESEVTSMGTSGRATPPSTPHSPWVASNTPPVFPAARLAAPGAASGAAASTPLKHPVPPTSLPGALEPDFSAVTCETDGQPLDEG